MSFDFHSYKIYIELTINLTVPVELQTTLNFRLALPKITKLFEAG